MAGPRRSSFSQSAKTGGAQADARRGWAGALQTDAVGLTEAAVRRAGFPDPALVFRWADIAGPDTAKVAKPIRCRTGSAGLVLTVKCDPAASVFLQHETRGLLERVNAYLGAGTVTRIQIVAGPLMADIEPPARTVAALPPADAKDGERPLENALKRLENLRGRVGRSRTRPAPCD